MSNKCKVVLILSIVLANFGCDGDSTSSKQPVAKKLELSSGNVIPATIYAENDVSDEYLIHAANILSEYLDNDQNGNWDNAQLAIQLSNAGATLIIPKTENSAEEFLNSLPASLQAVFNDDLVSQVLYEEEMILCSEASFSDCFRNISSGRDASYEEILHLITHVGYAQLYPNLFGENFALASTIAVANDKARDDVGRLLNDGNLCTEQDGELVCNWQGNYGVNAWYTYTDETCDYSCMVTEYTYWTVNAALGMFEHLSASPDYSNEYKCLTRSSFEAGNICEHDLGIEALWGVGSGIVAGQLVPGANTYNFPTSIPYGTYSPNGNPINWQIDVVYEN